MPQLCEKFNKLLKPCIMDSFLPISTIYWNQQSSIVQQINYNINLPKIFIQAHIFYLREFKTTQINNRRADFQRSTHIHLDTLSDLRLIHQRKNYIDQTITFEETETQTTQIHCLQLSDKNLETKFFSLDDLETTVSSYESDTNYSFVDSSFSLF